MNAQPNWLPETITITIDREDLKAYVGESYDEHNELAASIHELGAEKAVTRIVKQTLMHRGLRMHETRKVSRQHAELALCGAIHRMYAAIHHALNAPDPEDGGDADLTEMTLEAGLDAASTALELTNVLDIGGASETEPDYTDCLREWSESFNYTGDRLEIEDEAVNLDMVFIAAKTHLNLTDEQLAALREKARELTDVRRLAIQMFQEGE